MALPITYAGALVLFYLEDAATPGTFTSLCGLNQSSFTWIRNTTSTTLRDCVDPTRPGVVERDVESVSFEASGSGFADPTALDRLHVALMDANPVNARCYIGALTDTANGRYYAGALHIARLQVTGRQGGERAQIEVSLESTGPFTINTTT